MCNWGVSSVIFGKLPFSPSGQQRCSFFPIPGVRLGDGAGSCNLGGGMETASLDAPAKEPTSSEQPLPINRDRRCRGAALCHDTTKMVQLNWGATGARRGDPPVADADQFDYLSKQDGQETILLSIFSKCDRPMLFGRLEAAGALRWADWAAIARRWAE